MFFKESFALNFGRNKLCRIFSCLISQACWLNLNFVLHIGSCLTASRVYFFIFPFTFSCFIIFKYFLFYFSSFYAFFFFELFGTESFSISNTFLFFMTSSLYQVFHWWSLSKSTWLDIFPFSYCLSVLLSSSGQEICLPYFMLCKTPCALMTPINNKS